MENAHAGTVALPTVPPLPPIPATSEAQLAAETMNFSSNTFVNFESTAIANEGIHILQRDCAPNALHNSEAVDKQGMCTPGTREDTIQTLKDLAGTLDEDSSDTIWLHGPAGGGKSAIMRTIARDFANDNTLLASFFFYHADKQRNHSKAFVPTIAYQCAINLPTARQHISSVITRNPLVTKQSVRHQSKTLLEPALLEELTNPRTPSRWPPNSPLVIIIDGLDECMKKDRQAEILESMVRLVSLIRNARGPRLKVIIASRPESKICDAFEHLAESGVLQFGCKLALTSNDAEIETFYEEKFVEMRRIFKLPASWPSPDDLAWLVTQASGQYAFAHVAISFMLGGQPELRLRMIRHNIPSHGLQPFEPLDYLYVTVFRQIPPEVLPTALNVVRLLIDGALSRGCQSCILDILLSLPRGSAMSLQPYLSSLLDFDDDMQPYHKTLYDFLIDPERCGKFNLYVEPSALQKVILQVLISHFSPPYLPTLTFEEREGLSIFLDTSALFVDGEFWGLDNCVVDDETILQLSQINYARLDIWSAPFFYKLLKGLNSSDFKNSLSALTARRVERLWGEMQDRFDMRRRIYTEDLDGNQDINAPTDRIFRLLHLIILWVSHGLHDAEPLFAFAKHALQENMLFLAQDVPATESLEVGWNIRFLFLPELSSLGGGAPSAIDRFIQANREDEGFHYTYTSSLSNILDTIFATEPSGQKNALLHVFGAILGDPLSGPLANEISSFLDTLQTCIVRCWLRHEKFDPTKDEDKCEVYIQTVEIAYNFVQTSKSSWGSEELLTQFLNHLELVDEAYVDVMEKIEEWEDRIQGRITELQVVDTS